MYYAVRYRFPLCPFPSFGLKIHAQKKGGSQVQKIGEVRGNTLSTNSIPNVEMNNLPLAPTSTGFLFVSKFFVTFQIRSATKNRLHKNREPALILGSSEKFSLRG